MADNNTRVSNAKSIVLDVADVAQVKRSVTPPPKTLWVTIDPPLENFLNEGEIPITNCPAPLRPNSKYEYRLCSCAETWMKVLKTDISNRICGSCEHWINQ